MKLHETHNLSKRPTTFLLMENDQIDEPIENCSKHLVCNAFEFCERIF